MDEEPSGRSMNLRQTVKVEQLAEKSVEALVQRDAENHPLVPASRDDRVGEHAASETNVLLESATTVLLCPVSMSNAMEELDGLQHLPQLLKARKCFDALTGKDFPLWEDTKWSVDVREFDDHFQRLSGLIEDGDPSTFRLSLTKEALNLLLSGAELSAFTQANQLVTRAALFSDVTLLVFPNASMLSFRIDWKLPTDSFDFSLADLVSWSYLAKFKTVRPGVVRGWTFNNQIGMSVEHDHDKLDRARKMMSGMLFGAKHGNEGIGLGHLAAWLVMRPNEVESEVTKRRINFFTPCKHHSCFRVGGQLDIAAHAAELQQILTQEGAANRWTAVNEDLEMVVLRPRQNRYIALSQEGVLAVEWDGSTELSDLFLGPFLILSMHVMSERDLLVKLSVLAAISSKNMGDSHSVMEKQNLRREMMRLVRVWQFFKSCFFFQLVFLSKKTLVKYNLEMNSDQCGGRKVFRIFFSKLRQIFRVADMRLELREGLQDTFSVSEEK